MVTQVGVVELSRLVGLVELSVSRVADLFSGLCYSAPAPRDVHELDWRQFFKRKGELLQR
jgi:hypothetical protein